MCGRTAERRKRQHVRLCAYFEDVRPSFLHHVCEAEEMEERLSNKALPLTVAPQSLTNLSLVGLTRQLQAENTNTCTLIIFKGTCSVREDTVTLGHLSAAKCTENINI